MKPFLVGAIKGFEEKVKPAKPASAPVARRGANKEQSADIAAAALKHKLELAAFSVGTVAMVWAMRHSHLSSTRFASALVPHGAHGFSEGFAIATVTVCENQVAPKNIV